MLDIFKEFATDPKLELEGAWIDIGSGCRLLVARGENRRYLDKLEALHKQHKAQLDVGGESADAAAEKIVSEAMAEGILLDWENLQFKGKALKHSVENAKKVLAIRDFRKLVSRLANDIENYRVKEEADAVKN